MGRVQGWWQPLVTSRRLATGPGWGWLVPGRNPVLGLCAPLPALLSQLGVEGGRGVFLSFLTPSPSERFRPGNRLPLCKLWGRKEPAFV